MTLVARNRLASFSLVIAIMIMGTILYWMIQVPDVKPNLLALVSIVSALLLSICMFLLILFAFPKTNATELTLLIIYAFGFLLQPARLFLNQTIYITNESIHVFTVYLAVFGYFLSMITMLFIILYEMNAFLGRTEEMLFYSATLLYIFVFSQPLNVTIMASSYLFRFADVFPVTLLRLLLIGLIWLLAVALVFNQDDTYRAYIASSIILLTMGLRSLFFAITPLNVVFGIITQLLGIILFFIFIRRRYFWFKWS